MLKLDLIAFDADDTLWHSETVYVEMKKSFAKLLAPYHPTDKIEEKLDQIELVNLASYGYGIKSFILSLIEAGVELSHGRITGKEVAQMLSWGKDALAADVELFHEAQETLAALSVRYPLMLITKGDLNHQEDKILRSGLKAYFRYIEIVSDKNPDVYARILAKYEISPTQFMMVGDSLRSDILPVVELGGRAVFIPHDVVWGHERPAVPAGSEKAYAELDHIGQLAEWIEELERTV